MIDYILKPDAMPSTDQSIGHRDEFLDMRISISNINYSSCSYAPIKPETICLIFEESDMIRHRWARLFCWMMSVIRRGDRLTRRQRKTLGDALIEKRLNPKAIDDLFVAQFTYAQASAGAFNGNPECVRQGLKALTEMGVIYQAFSGVKGNASMYIIAPFPAQLFTHDCE